MKQLSGKDFAKLIQQRGWTLARISGSHHIFTKAGQHERVVIPVHGNRPLKIGLLRNQMRIVGMTESHL